MMEESKYYTPSIEEFRINFKYEEWNEYQKKWCKSILSYENLESLGSFMYHFLESFESNQIRVKYLDQQDIESCGFEYDELIYTRECRFDLANDKSEKDIIPPLDDALIIVSLGDNNNVRITIFNKHTEKYIHLFTGTIKNLSELKVLLTQLGITY